MKYVIVQGDGMADQPQGDLSGCTPLEAADTPNMDRIAAGGKLGLVETIPPSLPPGSSVGNISLMGLDPEKYFTGRAPLEARGQGVEIGEEDLAFRCNLVKIKENGRGPVMEDYSGGHPSDSEAEDAISALRKELKGDRFRLYQGVSYRHLLVWKGGRKEIGWKDLDLTPPHDISGQKVGKHLPRGEGSDVLERIQKQGKDLLQDKKGGVNGIWLWGAGVRPEVPTFRERYDLGGAVVSAVDLIKGIGSYAGLEPLEVEGVTGFIDTNYEGKVRAALDALKEVRLVYLHIEAPDEASHMGDLQLKLEAIEKVDELVLGSLLKALEGEADVRVLVATDHLTGVESGTHERGPVPFAFSSPNFGKGDASTRFHEKAAREGGLRFPGGSELMDSFLSEG